MKRMVERLSAMSLSLCFMVTFATLGSAQEGRSTRDGKPITAAEALRRYEERLQTSSEPLQIFYLTTKAAATALAAGEITKARAYAQDLLQQAAAHQENWNHGNAIQVGNLVLGLIALKADNVPEAKRLLLEAGKSRGSPQLNSFGPNFRLAKELLARGEREVVIEYFDLCAEFWKRDKDKDRLEDWKALVNGGRIPNCGANLNYQLDTWRFEDWTKLQP